MREEKLFRAIGQIDDDLIEGATVSDEGMPEVTEEALVNDDASEMGSDKIPSRGAGRKSGWWKYAVTAASVVLVIGIFFAGQEKSNQDTELAQREPEVENADLAWQENLDETETIDKIAGDKTNADVTETEEQTIEKDLMDFTIAYGGMGYEGIMGYVMLERGNPWRETDEIDTLPIIENDTVYSYERYSNDMWLSQERYEEMESWLTEVAAYFGMEDLEQDRNRTEVVVSNEKIRIKVDGDMSMRIEFLEEPPLPEEFNTTTEATMEETYALAEYILADYGELFGIENAQITVIESDYTFAGERYHHDVRFYDAGDNAKEQLLNYHFDYADYHLNDEGELWFIDIVHKDRNVLGEYEIISLEEATNRLLAGEYGTTYYGEDTPTAEYIRDVELMYYMGWEDDYKPYYRFWVEVPAEKRENGLNTYVAYYVPAVEAAYLKINFN